MFHLPKLQRALPLLDGYPVFFIGGAPKSGTTWLQMLLDSHPEISCRGEAHIADELAPLLTQALSGYSERIQRRNTHAFSELPPYPDLGKGDALSLVATAAALILCEHAAPKPTARVIGEKTPDNVLFFTLLSRLFPQARFIIAIRDGRDCAVSGWHHNQRSEPEMSARQFGSFNEYADTVAHYWARNLQAGMDFAASRPGFCHLLRFEDLIADTEAILTRAFNFLNVSATKPIVEHCVSSCRFDVLSGRDRGEEDRASFFRKGVSGDWREAFDAATLANFRAIAGDWLTRFGYD